MSETKILLALLLSGGTLLWLLLLISSLLFAPKRGAKTMRLREQSLLVVSGLLLIAWGVVLAANALGHV